MSRWGPATLGILCLAGVTGPLSTQGIGDRRIAAGSTLYRHYCAACHGASAKGTGPVAPYLRVPPPDLTRLSERYGWPLPRTGLARYIDGRFDPGAHGTREMPVWGERLEELPPQIIGEAEKAAVIELILDYLESIQGRAKT